jgi:outer membrane protein OmpA-like peptidoglycan-associated protein
MAVCVLLLAFLPKLGQAQNAALTQADKLYENLAFHEAIAAYEAVAKRNEGLPTEQARRLADSYRLTGLWTGAERWYAQVLASGVQDTEDLLHYAQALQRNGKFQEAERWFLRYGQRQPEDPRGPWGVQALRARDSLAEGGMRARIIGLDLNTPAAELGPALLDGGLLFSSDREGPVVLSRDHRWTGRPFLRLWWAPLNAKGQLGAPQPYAQASGSTLEGPYHDGPIALDSTRQRMFITRNGAKRQGLGTKALPDAEGKVRLRIEEAVREEPGGSWSIAPDGEGFPFNQSAHSLAHPAWHPAGTVLVFAADLPNGEGGIDLWMSIQDASGSWGVPQNLGPSINTPGDELFPVWQADGKLVFSSDARPGLGGLDCFVTEALSASGETLEAPAYGCSWSTPHNLGQPVNSSSDDFGLVLFPDLKRGYLVSDRQSGAGGDDIYRLDVLFPELTCIVQDARTGAVLDSVRLELRQGPARSQAQTGIEGLATLPWPEDALWSDSAQLSAARIGYHPLRIRVDQPDPYGGPRQPRILALEPTTRLRLKGLVQDRYRGTPLAGADVYLDDSLSGERRWLLADEAGEVLESVQPDRVYHIEVQFAGYQSDTFRLDTRGLSGVLDIERIFPLVEATEDVVLSLRHIYYDLDKAYIRQDAAPDLDRLAALMLRYPEMRIQLASHTDERGSTEYNQGLSERRARAAVNYLARLGVERARMEPKGYGESRPLRSCAVDPACTERDHQLNRRTEFKVLSAGMDLESEAREDMPVNTWEPARLKAFLEAELQGLDPNTAYPGTIQRSTDPSEDPASPLAGLEGDPAVGGAMPFGRGRAYGVELGEGSLAKAERYASYQRLAPLQVEAGSDARYRFVLGYFRERTEAERVLKQALEAGAQNARLVQYRNGKRYP